MSCSKILNIDNNQYQINNHHINLLRENEYETESDSDGSIEEDDIENLEIKWLGILIQGEYIIVKYIGRGTFSRVWLSYQFKTKKFYILKIYFPEFDEEFEDEIEIYNRIENISLEKNIKMIDTASYKNQSIIILPYMGLSLDELLELSNDITYLEFKHLCKEILLGIQELHKLKIIHNDIKIDNILTDYYSKDSVKFCDFIKKLKIEQLYDICYNTYKPDNFHELNKEKKKKIKKKIKPKINKLLSNKILELILQYQEEEENASNLGDSIDLNNIEFIEENNSNDNLQLINLNNYKTQLEDETHFNNYINKKEERELMNIQLSELSEINLNENLSKDFNQNNSSIDSSIDSNINNSINSNIDNSIDSNINNSIDSNIDNQKKKNNILNLKIKIIDYSNSELINLINPEEDYQIRAFRSPENIMGDTYSFKSEIWALGCLFWYILTKEYIFEPELIGTSIERDCNQLKIIEKYIGKIPEKIKLKCRKTYELFQDQNIKEKNDSKESTIYYTLLEKTLKENKSDFTNNQINNIVGFLKCIFTYNPNDRFSISQCLNHSFLLF